MKVQQSYEEILKEREEEGKKHSVPIKETLNAELLDKSEDEEDYEQIEIDDD